MLVVETLNYSTSLDKVTEQWHGREIRWWLWQFILVLQVF